MKNFANWRLNPTCTHNTSASAGAGETSIVKRQIRKGQKFEMLESFPSTLPRTHTCQMSFFVETEDIDLGHIEEEMEQLVKNVHVIDEEQEEEEQGEDDEGSAVDQEDRANPDNDANNEQSDEAMPPSSIGISEEKSPGDHNTTLKRMLDPSDEPTDDVQATSASALNPDKKRKIDKTKAKEKAHMTASEYQSITAMIKLYLNSLEKEAGSELPATVPGTASTMPAESATEPIDSTDKTQLQSLEKEKQTLLHIQHINGEFQGIRWSALVNWCLQQENDLITTVDQLEHRRKVLSLVIRRMLKSEGSLIVVDGHDLANEEKTLRLHPSQHE